MKTADALWFYRIERFLERDDPFGVTMAEYVRFRRLLLRGGIRHSHMILGHRVVLIPSDWTVA